MTQESQCDDDDDDDVLKQMNRNTFTVSVTACALFLDKGPNQMFGNS